MPRPCTPLRRGSASLVFSLSSSQPPSAAPSLCRRSMAWGWASRFPPPPLHLPFLQSLSPLPLPPPPPLGSLSSLPIYRRKTDWWRLTTTTSAAELIPQRSLRWALAPRTPSTRPAPRPRRCRMWIELLVPLSILLPLPLAIFICTEPCGQSSCRFLIEPTSSCPRSVRCLHIPRPLRGERGP